MGFYDEALVKAISDHDYDDLEKAHVKAFMRRTKSGNLVEVKEHEDKRLENNKIAYRQRYGKEAEGDHAEREADKGEMREHQKAQEYHGARTWEYKHPNLSKEERAEHSKKWNEHHQAEIDAEIAYQKKYAGTNQFKEGDIVKDHGTGYCRGAVGKVTKVHHHPKYGTHYQIEYKGKHSQFNEPSGSDRCDTPEAVLSPAGKGHKFEKKD